MMPMKGDEDEEDLVGTYEYMAHGTITDCCEPPIDLSCETKLHRTFFRRRALLLLACFTS
jgi:hypothetical protein